MFTANQHNKYFRRVIMPIKTMLTVAEAIANGRKVKMPAMRFSDWDLFCRCLKEAKSENK